MIGSGGLTHDEIEVACRNVGVDLRCGQCAACFYTGLGASGVHERGCQTGLTGPLLVRLQREMAVIQAMHHRPWWRVGILGRRPWRASWRPRTLRQTWDWLTKAHDCYDPAVGCSCSGGYRFPKAAT